MPLIEVQQLTKRFGSASGGILAVDGVSFTVHAGEVVGFLGPNGAGKSTTMKMITGFLPATSGRAVLNGFDVRSHTLQAQRGLGYLPEGAPAYPDMTPASFLGFCARARGLRGEQATKAIDRAVERTNLQAVLKQPVDTLSKGFKRRVGLAQAIMHEPPVLIMDEPTDGLDPNQKHEVRTLIKDMARAGSGAGASTGKAIVLSTHILEEVEAVCTRAIMIHKGKIVFDGTPEALLARGRGHGSVRVALHAPAGAKVRDELLGLESVRSAELVGERASLGGSSTWLVTPRSAADGPSLSPRVLALCQARGWQVESITLDQARMDDVFRELTSG